MTHFYGLKKLIRVTFRAEPANTKYFSPLLYAIFYGQKAIVQHLISNDLINGFSSLKEPPETFVEEQQGDV